MKTRSSPPGAPNSPQSVILVALLQFGILSDSLTRRNMDLFAAEVMPHLKG
jgi:hypothetical protein